MFFFFFFTWQNTIRISKIQKVCPSSELCKSLGLLFQFTILIPRSFDGPSFDALWACAPVYISLNVHTVPSVLPLFLFGWLPKFLHLLEEGQNDPIVHFAYLCHMICEQFKFVFFSFLYIKLYELGVEVASAVTHNKINVFKFPIGRSCSECTDGP